MRVFRVKKSGEFVAVTGSMLRSADGEYTEELDTEFHLDIVLATIKEADGTYKNAVVVTIHETMVMNPKTGKMEKQGCEQGVEEEIGQMIREQLKWEGAVVINHKKRGPTREEVQVAQPVKSPVRAPVSRTVIEEAPPEVDQAPPEEIEVRAPLPRQQQQQRQRS